MADYQLDKSDRVFNFVRDLQKDFCPIDGVNMKVEVPLTWSQEMIDGVEANINRYKD